LPRLSKELQSKLEEIHSEISKDDTLKGIINELMDELTEGGKDREYIINLVFNALPELKKQASMFRELD